MESIEQHIAKDKEILQDPTTSPQQRRHVGANCTSWKSMFSITRREIEAGDHHESNLLRVVL